MDQTKKVNVRWNDGFLESFECCEARIGSDYLWMHLVNGQNRWVPTRGIRWFSMYPDSKEPATD